MQGYELTPSAQKDLKEIARYTLTTWGKTQAMHYAGLLETHFAQIASKSVHPRTFSARYPQILVSRCEQHYIFYVHQTHKPVRIIAVLHERMDMLARLKNRLK